MNLDGSYIREMTIPEYHLRDTARGTRGVQQDCGYQGLSISADNRLYVMTGCPLVQNSDPVTNSGQQYAPEGGYAVSMLVYDISGTSTKNISSDRMSQSQIRKEGYRKIW